MPASKFTTEEVQHLSKFISEWRKLKTEIDTEDSILGVRKRRIQLVQKACDTFFEAFRDRDPTQTDPGPRTFSDQAMKKFPDTVRSWLNNKTRDTATASKRGPKTSTKPKTTARHLVQKKYSEQIDQQAKVIASESEGMHILKARNLATTALINQLKSDNAAEWDELEQQAVNIRAAPNADHTDQTPETLQRILEQFPKVLFKQVEDWSRTTGALIFAMAIFATPDDPALKSYLVLSARLQAFEGTPAEEQVRDNILDWIETHLGSGASPQAKAITATVYPDKDGGLRPMIPFVPHIQNFDRILLRSWIRLYLTYLWKWQGGTGPVPWKRIERAEDGEYVDMSRLPGGVWRLADPHTWTRLEIEAWYQHILAGQLGKVPESQIFQFLRVDRNDGTECARYTSFCRARPTISNLTWSPDEKLYALQLSQANGSSGSNSEWAGLPTARSTLVYAPFEQELVEVFSMLNAPDTEEPLLANLCRLVQEAEAQGPVHTIDAKLYDLLNPHLPAALPSTLLRDFSINELIAPEFFDDSSPQWSEFALPTLISWVQSAQNPFRHSPSDTWRGGPNGVRWIVALVARFFTTLTLIDQREDIPAHIQSRVSVQQNKQNWKQLIILSKSLAASLASSNKRLGRTFRARATAWKAEVVKAYLAGQLDDPQSVGALGAITNGVPRDAEELFRAYQYLTETDPDVTFGEASITLPAPRRRRPRRRRIDSDSEGSAESSGTDVEQEEIEIPSFSSEESVSELGLSADDHAITLAEESFRIDTSFDPNRCASPSRLAASLAEIASPATAEVPEDDEHSPEVSVEDADPVPVPSAPAPETSDRRTTLEDPDLPAPSEFVPRCSGRRTTIDPRVAEAIALSVKGKYNRKK